MFFAFIPIVNAIIIVSFSTILLFQCATAKRPNQQRKSPQKSTRSRKSSRSRRSQKSGESSRSSKSSKSGKSSRSSKSGKSRSSKSSNKSYKLRANPKGHSDKKVHAAILADRKAAEEAVKPQQKLSNEHSSTSEKQMNHLQNDNEKKNHKVSYSNVRVIPHEMNFPQIGGLKHVRVKNSTGKRIVFMVKCSDNMLFNINPVYGIIESDRDAQINILRENGEAKHDKLVIITAAHTDINKTAEQTFANIHQNNSHNYNINVVPLLTQ